MIESPENALFEINKDGFEGRIENFNWRTVLREYAKRFYGRKKKKVLKSNDSHHIHIGYAFYIWKNFFVFDINSVLYILFRYSIDSDGMIWWWSSWLIHFLSFWLSFWLSLLLLWRHCYFFFLINLLFVILFITFIVIKTLLLFLFRRLFVWTEKSKKMISLTNFNGFVFLLLKFPFWF